MKTKKEIIQLLSADEPDYSSIISKLTKEDYKTINELAKHRSTAIATRAIICLGYLGSKTLKNGIVVAAKSNKRIFRLTAAQALSKMTGVSSNKKARELITKLTNDRDAGVRKFALKTAGVANIPGLKKEPERNIQIKHTVSWKQKKPDKKPAR
jgi:hypothetical protein